MNITRVLKYREAAPTLHQVNLESHVLIGNGMVVGIQL